MIFRLTRWNNCKWFQECHPKHQPYSVSSMIKSHVSSVRGPTQKSGALGSSQFVPSPGNPWGESKLPVAHRSLERSLPDSAVRDKAKKRNGPLFPAEHFESNGSRPQREGFPRISRNPEPLRQSGIRCGSPGHFPRTPMALCSLCWAAPQERPPA